MDDFAILDYASELSSWNSEGKRAQPELGGVHDCPEYALHTCSSIFALTFLNSVTQGWPEWLLDSSLSRSRIKVANGLRYFDALNNTVI